MSGYELAGGAWRLGRAREAAEPTTDTRLRELDFGELEGAAWNQLSPTQRQSLTDFDQFVAPGGESVTELKARVHAFLSDLDTGRHVIVTHGGVIRLICRELGKDQHIGPGTLTRLSS